MKTPQDDPITTPPDMTGTHGKAWRVSGPAEIMKAFAAVYLVEAAYAHPVWHSYAFALVDLKPFEGLAPAVLYIPNATFEFHIWALNPQESRQKMLDTGQVCRLSPINFAAQSTVPEDEVRARFIQSIDDVINGRISPDTDYISMWIERWGDNMVKGRERIIQ